MKRNKSRRERIILMLNYDPDKKLSCQEITKEFIKQDNITGRVAQYLSGSISSTLAKLVKDGTLKYAKETAIRGGHLYQLNIENNSIKQLL